MNALDLWPALTDVERIYVFVCASVDPYVMVDFRTHKRAFGRLRDEDSSFEHVDCPVCSAVLGWTQHPAYIDFEKRPLGHSHADGCKMTRLKFEALLCDLPESTRAALDLPGKLLFAYHLLQERTR